MKKILGAASGLLLGFALSNAGFAQSSPWQLFQTEDGTLWIVADGLRHKAAPAQISMWVLGQVPEGDAWMTGTLGSPAQPQQQAAPPSPNPRTASFKGLTLTVLDVQRGWKPDSQYVKAKPGMEHLAADIRIENGGAEAKDYNIYDPKIATADSARWDPDPGWRKPDFGSGQVLPGSSVRGWALFQVPIGNPASQLIWEPSYSNTIAIQL